MQNNKTYLQLVRVICFILLLIFIVLWTKAYIGYFAIQETIKQNYARHADLQSQLSYIKNYFIPYLRSDYAGYFVNHEHGFANSNEVIIKFTKKTEVHIPSIVVPQSDPDKTGEIQWWRLDYLRYKRNKASESWFF